jgi:hypothetical protein
MGQHVMPSHRGGRSISVGIGLGTVCLSFVRTESSQKVG